MLEAESAVFEIANRVLFMARQIITIGSVIEIPLAEDLYAYGQIISRTEVAFFDYIGCQLDKKHLPPMSCDCVLFVVSVMNNAITSGRWKKIQKMEIDGRFLGRREYFMQDAITQRISIYQSDDGAIRPGLRSEAQGLERAAVWSPEQVEERLRDCHDNKPNRYVESMQLV